MCCSFHINPILISPLYQCVLTIFYLWAASCIIFAIKFTHLDSCYYASEAICFGPWTFRPSLQIIHCCMQESFYTVHCSMKIFHCSVQTVQHSVQKSLHTVLCKYCSSTLKGQYQKLYQLFFKKFQLHAMFLSKIIGLSWKDCFGGFCSKKKKWLPNIRMLLINCISEINC